MNNNDIAKKADCVIEVSWEVCNKVGGIYTVITSKSGPMVSNYGKDNYYLIGPYFHKKASGEFEELMPPEKYKEIFYELKKEGIYCHYGRWLIKGEPTVILIDFAEFRNRANDIKTQLWLDYKIDSLNSPYDFDEAAIWATAAGMVIEKLISLCPEKKVVAQFHEWIAGAGLLYLKSKGTKVGTVFTTHATILGRSLASNNVNLYDVLDKVDADQEAYNNSIPAKYQTEKACALNADVFTTVSEITALEAEKLLKRKPEVVLPNGLDIESFPTFEDISVKHRQLKYKIKEFILYYFFPYYTFDIDETYIFFIFGRYEFRNKGIDIFIKALARLNQKMKEEKSNRTIVAFFFIPSYVKGIKSELIENKTFYEDIKESVEMNIDTVRSKLIYTLVSGKQLARENLFEQEFLSEVKRKLLKFKRDNKPRLTTHDLWDEDNDIIIRTFKEGGLKNDQEDKVKVILYPTYLTGADGLLDISYYDTIMGSHLGVFPSLYEPWGYTPLETAALGVASVTSDLSGFGMYIQDKCDPERPGIFILKRNNRTEEQVIADMYDILHDYSKLSREERIQNKIQARRLASMADWKNLIKYYIAAHNMAIDSAGSAARKPQAKSPVAPA